MHALLLPSKSSVVVVCFVLSLPHMLQLMVIGVTEVRIATHDPALPKRPKERLVMAVPPPKLLQVCQSMISDPNTSLSEK